MTILHSLVGLYERLAADEAAPDEAAPAFGFSRENISYAILLSQDGDVVDVQDIRDTSGQRPRPKRLVVPRAVKRTGQPVPNFLWDKTAFALGAGTREPSRIAREHAAFKDFHRKLLETCEDLGARAFLRFLERWRADDFRSLRYAEDMLDANVVFRLDGAALFLHGRHALKDVWLNHLAEQDGAKGMCLVTGQRAAIARLHPSVKGVAGAQSSGASMVSFDKDAFKSFGKERGANAPVSERAAFAYAAALNTLLERDSRRRIQIGDATTVFWAEAAGDDTGAAAAEELFSLIAAPPTDAEETTKVADRLTAIAAGRPLAEVNPKVDKNTRFCVLGIAPNAARVSIRFWYQDTIGELASRIVQHWSDLRLEPAPWRTPPAAWRLLKETAPQGKAQNIPPTLGGALMRAILGGGRYPRSLLAAVIGRMRADKNVTGMRAAICKACLARDHRLGVEKEDVPMKLRREEANPAYRLGRLFAVYEKVQREALGRNLNATIKDRCFGAASATPAAVFPLLVRNSANHLASIRKRGKGGLAHHFDDEIDEIFAGMDTAFPRSLRLEDQGRFAIGYHHQRGTRGKGGGSDASGGAVESPSTPDNED